MVSEGSRPRTCRGAVEPLGVMYEQGHGVVQSDKEALVWYRKAADQGLAEAQFLLGYMYEEGQGVPKYTARTLSWYRKAAAQGHKKARGFSAIYEAGTRRVRQLRGPARPWWGCS